MRATLLLVVFGSIAITSQGSYVMNQVKVKSLSNPGASDISFTGISTAEVREEGPMMFSETLAQQLPGVIVAPVYPTVAETINAQSSAHAYVV